MTGLIVVAEVGPHCINHIYDVVAGLFKTTHDVHVKDCGLIFVVVLVYVCYVSCGVSTVDRSFTMLVMALSTYSNIVSIL